MTLRFYASKILKDGSDKLDSPLNGWMGGNRSDEYMMMSVIERISPMGVRSWPEKSYFSCLENMEILEDGIRSNILKLLATIFSSLELF